MKILKNNSFIVGTGIYLFSNIINAIIPFILLPILTRYLSPEEYGQVAMFQTLIGGIGAFVGLAFVGAASRKYYDSNLSKKELAEFIGTCFQLSLISLILVCVIIFLFQVKISSWLALEPIHIFFAVFVAFSSVVMSLRLGQWQVRKKAIHYGVFQISQSLLNMLLSLWFVICLLDGVNGRVNAQTIASLTFLMVGLFLLNKEDLIKYLVWKKEYIEEVIKFGIPLIPHIAGSFLLLSVDRFIINREIGLAEVGVYMVAVQLTAIMGVVFDAVNKAYVPWLFDKLKENEHKQNKKIVKLTYLWFLLIVIGVLIIFFTGPSVVVFIAGEEYSQAGSVIGWLALGQGFQGMYLMVTNYIFFTKRTGMLSLISMGTGLLNLIFLIIFIRIIGLEGAAIAFAISMGLRFLLIWFIANKRYAMPWFSFI